MLGVVGVADVVRRRRLRWLGHVKRMDPEDWVSRCRELLIEVRRVRGRPRQTWIQNVRDDMRRLGLVREDAQDCIGWRSGVLGNCRTRASMDTQTLNRSCS